MSVSEEIEFFIREKRCEVVKRNAVSDEFRSASVDIFDPYEREVLVSCLWRSDFSGNRVSCLESMLLYLILRHVYVIRRVEIVVV